MPWVTMYRDEKWTAWRRWSGWDELRTILATAAAMPPDSPLCGSFVEFAGRLAGRGADRATCREWAEVELPQPKMRRPAAEARVVLHRLQHRGLLSLRTKPGVVHVLSRRLQRGAA